MKAARNLRRFIPRPTRQVVRGHASPSRTQGRRRRPPGRAPACRGACASRSRSAQESMDSRYPSASATSSFVPSSRTPRMTSRQTLSCSTLAFRWIPFHSNECDPHVHVVGARQLALAERGRLVLPLARQPGDARDGQASTGAEELPKRGGEVAAAQPVQVQQRPAPQRPAGTSWPTPAGSPRRTASAHQWRRRPAGR
jgi:hypothetical protein